MDAVTFDVRTTLHGIDAVVTMVIMVATVTSYGSLIGQERAISHLYQCIVSNLYELIIYAYGHVKSS
jgi:hypothetical protein